MQNIEIVKELYRAFREKDHEALKRICAPGIEWIQNEGFPNGGTHSGADAIVQNVFDAFSDAWESFGFRIAEFVDGKDTVIVLGEYHGVARQSRKKMRADACHVYSLADGKITRFRQYTDTKRIWDALTP